jgi:subtilisin family serine protease
VSTSVFRELPGLSEAWTVTRGANAVVAVVDEAVDVHHHPEFVGRVLPGNDEARQAAGDGSYVHRPHGAKVAGIALANGPHVTGVAPEAQLLPVAVNALSRIIGHPSEADAIRWAAAHGADVICCAWAPPDLTGKRGRLPSRTRAALDYSIEFGRGGKGCVIIFSAGNDGSDLALNGYASHPGVIAVGACNCHGTHPSYSGYGEALWCVFPSNDPGDHVGAWMTYLTTAPVGSLLNGDAYYTTRFGFTSAACAGIAGICALIVSANPNLTAHEVKQVLRSSCEKIDASSGTYDARGHSPLYGYGRPDVVRAVHLATQHEKVQTASV